MTKTKKLPEFITLPGLGQLALSGARPLIGILLGLLAGAGLIALTGVNPLDAYAAMLNGAMGNPQSISNVLVRASPLLLGGVGVAIGIKAALWNIGTEGYIYMGAVGATAGCAVRAAVEQGEVHPQRYESYARMRLGQMEDD